MNKFDCCEHVQLIIGSVELQLKKFGYRIDHFWELLNVLDLPIWQNWRLTVEPDQVENISGKFRVGKNLVSSQPTQLQARRSLTRVVAAS